MSDSSDQKISDLSGPDAARLQEQRTVVERYLANEDSRQKYKSTAGKLGLLRAMLDRHVFKKDQTYELQCLGVVLGDAFVQELGMKWVIVEDAYGRDPAICVPQSSVLLYPLTMIAKRIENDESVDVVALFNGLAAEIDELKKDGR